MRTALQDGGDPAGVVLIENERVTRLVFLQLRNQEVVERTLPGAGRPHDEGVRQISLMEVEVVRSRVFGREYRQ